MSAARIVTDERVARYVAEKCKYEPCPPYTVMGLERDGRIIAGVVFNNWQERDISVTVAGEHSAFTRHFIREVGRYVFGDKLNCLRLSITTRHENVKHIALRLGAKHEGTKRNYYGPGQDADLFGILKEDWIYGSTRSPART